MSLTYVDLVLDLYDGQGSPVVTGQVTLSPNALTTDAGDHLTITQAPVTTWLAGNPLPSVRIVATDSDGLAPSGWGWTVQCQFPGVPPAATYEVPSTGGAVQYLSQLIPVVSGPVITTYALAADLAAETARARAAELATANGTAQVFTPLNYSAAGDGVTDDTTAVLAAASAAQAVHGIVDLGTSTFLTSAPIPTATGFHLRGAGYSGGGILNSTSSLFTCAGSQVKFENCTLTASGGHIFDATAEPACPTGRCSMSMPSRTARATGSGTRPGAAGSAASSTRTAISCARAPASTPIARRAAQRLAAARPFPTRTRPPGITGWSSRPRTGRRSRPARRSAR